MRTNSVVNVKGKHCLVIRVEMA